MKTLPWAIEGPPWTCSYLFHYVVISLPKRINCLRAKVYNKERKNTTP